VKSTLLYRSETWRITERSKRKLETVEMDVFRRMMRIFKRNKIKNEEIRTRVEVEDTIIKDIEEKQFIWYVRVLRMDYHRFPKQALIWIPRKKKKMKT
jgi:hypothetical protein